MFENNKPSTHCQCPKIGTQEIMPDQEITRSQGIMVHLPDKSSKSLKSKITIKVRKAT
jgi:hypothetical protein